MAKDNPALSQEIFNISMAKIDSEMEPNGVADDIWRESVALIGIHIPILVQISEFTWQ